jgi:hypothetical protein
MADISSENVAKFRYLRTPVTNQNAMLEEIKSRLNSGSICYHSNQNVLSSCPLSRNLKIKLHKTIILPLVLYACKTWPLTLREEHRLTVFEHRVLRRILRLKRNEIMGACRKLHNVELHNLYSSRNRIRMIKSRRMRWAGYLTHGGHKKCIQGFGRKARRKENNRKI